MCHCENFVDLSNFLRPFCQIMYYTVHINKFHSIFKFVCNKLYIFSLIERNIDSFAKIQFWKLHIEPVWFTLFINYRRCVFLTIVLLVLQREFKIVCLANHATESVYKCWHVRIQSRMPCSINDCRDLFNLQQQLNPDLVIFVHGLSLSVQDLQLLQKWQ
jgi:hypothetical protein